MRESRRRFHLLLLIICIPAGFLSYYHFFQGTHQITIHSYAHYYKEKGHPEVNGDPTEIEIDSSDIDTLLAELNLPRLGWMDHPIVIQFPYRFVHNPYKACYKKQIEILVAVVTSRANFIRRQVIRETWGKYVEIPGHRAVLLFFVGSSSESEISDVQSEIDKESARYEDIVQGLFSDTYRNLSLKSLSILKWVDTHCPQADFVTKVDDDVYVVLPGLVRQLRKTVKKRNRWKFLFGYTISGAVPVRKNDSKSYATKMEYSIEKYPVYTSGTSYSTTGRGARLLFQAALRTHLFWLEDVYITGLCARKSNIILIENEQQFIDRKNSCIETFGCFFKTKRKSIGHCYNASEIRRIHEELHDDTLRCIKVVDPYADVQKRVKSRSRSQC